MGSRFRSTLIVLAALLAAAGAAAAPAAAAVGHHPAPRPGAPVVPLPAARARAEAPAARAALLAGAAQVTGHVYDFLGNPLAGAQLFGSAGDATAEATSDAGGAFTLAGLPAASGDGSITVFPADGTYMNAISSMSWPDDGMDIDIQPGHLSTTIARGGPWADWSDVVLQAAGTDGSWGVSGGQWFTADTPTSDITAAPANLLKGTYTAATVNFYTFAFSDEGMEPAGSWTLSAGTLSADTLTAAEADAQRIFVSVPLWGSGKPGAQ